MVSRSIFESLPLNGFPAPGIPRQAWTNQAINLVLISLVGSLALTGAAASLRWIFPAAALGVAAALLLADKFGQYVTFCIWLFLLSPALRRIVDLEAGWEPLNTLLVAPYAAAGLSLIAIPLAIAGTPERVPGRAAFLAIVAAVTYALTLAVLNDRAVAGGYDYLRWAVPPCFGMLIAINAAKLEEVRHELSACLALALPIVGAYAIYQYFVLPEWDAYWMQSVDMQSIGRPEPEKVRVFSTMHSPGSLSNFLVVGIALLLVSPSRLRWIGLLLGMAAMALTLSRTAWVGLACAGLVLTIAAPLRARMSVLAFVGIVVLIAPIALVTPQLNHLLEERLDSLNEIAVDESYQDRASAYSQFADRLGDNVLGEGLAISGSTVSHVNRVDWVNFDGGPIEVFLALGLFGGTVYYLGIGLLAWRVMRASGCSGAEQALVAACKAIVVAALVLQASSTTTIGETGFFNWLGFGLGLAVGARARFSPIPHDVGE